MSIITMFSGSFCEEGPVVREIISRTGYRHVVDEEIIAEASRRSGLAENKIRRVFSPGASVFNNFTHEKERSLAYVRLVAADMIAADDILITCFSGQLIPKTISHVLRVCLIAPIKYRITAAAGQQGVSEKEAAKHVFKREEDCTYWINSLFNASDPWDAALYDIVVPIDKMTPQDAAALIADYAGKEVVKTTPASKQILEDYRLAAETEVAMINEGHTVDVSAREGAVTLTINKNVLMLNRLKAELKSIAEKIPAVNSVEIKIGKGFHRTDIYRKLDFTMPSKLLLVDDEREFVQTLSERLMMRDMGSAVAYDGESALKLINEDEPDVIIVDLKMPGINGLEVLRQVKETRPQIEVIILTGHGNEEDRKLCMELGAFAYLQKPLDINVLSETIRQANEKAKQAKGSKD